MEEFWKRYDAFSTQLQNLAGAAWDNLVLYKQAESIASLGVGFLALIVSVGLILFITKKLAPNWTYNVVFKEPMPERYVAGQSEVRYPSETHEYQLWEQKKKQATRNNGEANPLPIFGSIASAIGTFLLLVFVAGPELLYIWNWIGAFVPEARLFHDIFEALGPKITGTPAA